MRAFPFVLAAFALAACGGGGGDGPQPEPPRQQVGTRGLVLAAGSPSSPGGHRIVSGVLGGGAEAKSAQYAARGGARP